MARNGRQGASGRTFIGPVVFSDFPMGGPWRLIAFDTLRSNTEDPFDPVLKCVFERVESDQRCRSTVVKEAVVGWLPWLLLDTLWQDGRMISAKPYHDGRFDKEVVISPQTVKEFRVFERIFISRGNGHTTQEYVIPPNVQRFTGVASGFNLVAVQVGTDPLGFIVPAYVLAQFYAGSSTDLAQALFTGAYAKQPNPLYDSQASRRIDDCTFLLKLRRGVSLSDAWVIARFAAGDDGGPERTMYRRVHASLMVASANRQPLFASAAFPFQGSSRLKAAGIWFEAELSNGDPVRRFLALRMLRCTGPFPFDELVVEVDSPADPDHQPPDAQPAGPRIPVIAASLPRTLLVSKSGRPNPSLLPLSIPGASVTKRFGFLTGKHITVLKDAPSATRPSVCFVPGPARNLAATGVLSSSVSDVRKARATTSVESKAASSDDHGKRAPFLTASGQTFVEIMSSLEKCRGEVRSVIPIALDQPTHSVGPYCFGEIPPNGPRSTWHFLDGRPRLLFMAEIVTMHRHAYLIDFEPRGDETETVMMVVMRLNGHPLSRRLLNDIITLARRVRKLWGGNTANPQILKGIQWLGAPLIFHSIRHSQSTAAGYAQKIREKLVPEAVTTIPEAVG